MIKIAVVLIAIARVTISVLGAPGTSPYDLMNTTEILGWKFSWKYKISKKWWSKPFNKFSL